MDKQPTSYGSVIVAVVLLLLPLLYVGSYLALVVPKGRTVKVNSCVRIEYIYRVNDLTFVPRFYWPLEQLDQKVRQDAWGTRPLPLHKLPPALRAVAEQKRNSAP